MSSALKPVLTPSGAQNSSVPAQLNKPMHPQGASATYGQSMSHLPQNLVNIPHNPPNSANLHNPAHTVSNHNANHYSLNVPNASQHYTTVSGVTPNSNTNQTVSPPKNSTFNPTFQQNIGNSYKTPSVSTPTPPTPPPPPPPQTPTNLPSPPQPQNVTSSTTDTTTADKPQSNGTQESKDSNNSEVPQNYSMSQTIKEKVETVQCTTVLPEKSKETKEEVVSTPTVISSASEPKTNTDVNKSPPEVINSSPSTDKNCTPTDSTSLVNNVTESSPAVTTTTATTTTTVNSTIVNSTTVNSTTVNSTTVSPTQANQPTPTSSLPTESAATQETATPTTTTATKPKEQASQKSPVKLATTPRTPTRKPKSPKLETSDSPKTPKSTTEGKPANQKSPGSAGKAKRNRIKTQPYQCPLPEVELVSKISVTTPKTKNSEDKLIIFYKNEFLAVRNSEGGFYICQAVQNIYKSSPRIRIRWLSQDKNDKEAYSPDFYDYTDFDCILTNLNLSRMDKGKYRLPANERIRTDSILKRALAVEQGDATPPSLTEEHPDGLDLSLYKEESQLKKRKSLKRKSTSPLKSSPSSSSSSSKAPDQAKVRKVATKSKSLPVKKSTVLKRALSVKTKKIAASTRAERASKRKLEVVTAVSPKTSPVIDHKKAKVLAKVARRAAVAPPKVQAPPKQISKANKQVASTSKKTVPVTKKEKPVAVTRKSKRGKK